MKNPEGGMEPRVLALGRMIKDIGEGRWRTPLSQVTLNLNLYKSLDYGDNSLEARNGPKAYESIQADE